MIKMYNNGKHMETIWKKTKFLFHFCSMSGGVHLFKSFTFGAFPKNPSAFQQDLLLSGRLGPKNPTCHGLGKKRGPTIVAHLT